MAGTKIGGMKAAAANKLRNPNFYHEIGKAGGLKSRGGGFANNPELAREVGRHGGQVSWANKTPQQKKRFLESGRGHKKSWWQELLKW